MATLQKIRSKGVLLVTIIGIALLAFIAGDAWQIFQPHQNIQNAGVINGEKIDAQSYQKMVDEYSEVIKFMRGTSSLSEEELAQIKDETWSTLVTTKLLEAEAEKLGLVVTSAELQAVIDEGTHPMLAQSIFRNENTGKFDRDVLMKFLADYAQLDLSSMPGEYAEYYMNLYRYWKFIEKNLRNALLMDKYSALVDNAQLSNPVAADYNFKAHNNYTQLAYALIPFNSVADSTVNVSSSDVKKVYNEKKESFKQLSESRDLKYIDVTVLPSKADRAELLKEVNEYTTQLNEEENVANVIRLAGSEVTYSEVPRTEKGLPADVVARLDSVKVGDVYGPYYNAADDSYNAFKIMSTTMAPDSIKFRQMQIADADKNRTKELSDSIYTALKEKKGSNWAELAKQYNQPSAEGSWVASNQYEGQAITGDNATLFNTLNGMKKGEIKRVSLANADVIIEVLDNKNMVKKYHTAIIKRAAYFSNDTYNAAYNKLSTFVAANQTLEDITANAEENGFRLLDAPETQNYAHNIGGVESTREALRWAFNAKKGEVSQIFEVGQNDHLMVLAVEEIHEEGYRPVNQLENMLKYEAMNNKKADKIMAEAKNVKSMQEALALNGAEADTINRVTFSAPAFISSLYVNEPIISGASAKLGVNELSKPLKGNGGVYFVQVLKQNEGAGTFDAAKEQKSIIENTKRYINVNSIINELYMKGEIKDTRYLFF